MLNGKNILITAGPVWVPLDRVRVITNIFSGELGVTVAKVFAKEGVKVTLCLGPGRVNPPEDNKNIKIIRFRYYQEILDLVKKEVSSQKYDIMIHSAAISDYEPLEVQGGKIKSGQKQLTLDLKPTLKIVDLIKDLDPAIFLVKFKLEVGVTKDELIKIAYQSMLDSKADLIVANEFSEATSAKHKAYIIDPNKKITECLGKKDIAEKLSNFLFSPKMGSE